MDRAPESMTDTALELIAERPVRLLALPCAFGPQEARVYVANDDETGEPRVQVYRHAA